MEECKDMYLCVFTPVSYYLIYPGGLEDALAEYAYIWGAKVSYLFPIHSTDFVQPFACSFIQSVNVFKSIRAIYKCILM